MKCYVLDTNVLIESPSCVEDFLDNGTNKVAIPMTVLLELDKLKTGRVSTSAIAATRSIEQHRTSLLFPRSEYVDYVFREGLGDITILAEVVELQDDEDDIIFVSCDRVMRILASEAGLCVQEFKSANPFQGESRTITGVVKNAEQALYPNCFFFEKGDCFFNSPSGPIRVFGDAVFWGIKARSKWQSMMMEILRNPDVLISTIQGDAGYGKTFLALAAAFHLVFQDKLFRKIYVVRKAVEWGDTQGFLPGSLDEKISPYFAYLNSLIAKLDETRPVNRLFANRAKDDATQDGPMFDPKRFELVTPNFIQGHTIENAFVIVDEAQNLSREDMRMVLTRMGQNVRVVCLGDVRQVATPHLNEFNNGLNWVVKTNIGHKNFAHLVLKGKHSRGPICDMILKSGL